MRIEKTLLVESIGQMIEDSSFLFFVSYKGLNVKNFSALRDQLAEKDADCRVLKNRLIRKAAELKGIDALKDFDLKDDTAMIFGSGDASATAKVISEFFKKHSEVEAKGGYMEGSVLDVESVNAIATLPSREVLLSQLIGVIQAPAVNLVSVLNQKTSSIVNVLNAYKDKLENSN
jgi:large subunit ribosomal protein L10